MSNVIKQRQLSDGQKLTPKTDFVYTSVGSTVRQQVINIDGTIKTDDYLTTGARKGQSFSAGKGQVINIETSSTTGLTIAIFDKNTGVRLNSLKIDEDSTYIYSKKVATFLGKPFQAEGDNDRYVYVAFWDGATYKPILFNIDTWTTKDIGDTIGNPNVPFDFVYDGIEWVYGIFGGTSVWRKNIKTQAIEQLKDDAGVNIEVARIYGINQTEIIFKGTDGFLRRYIISTKGISTIGGSIDNPILNALQIPVIEEDGEDYVLTGFQQGQVILRTTNNSKSNNLQQSLVDGNIISSGEANVTPQLITNYVETDTTIEFEWVLTRILPDRVVGDCVKTTITKSNGSVVSTRLTTVGIDPIAEAGTSQEQLNNSFSHTCNSYGVGKFYDYGLQKQWDNNYEKM